LICGLDMSIPVRAWNRTRDKAAPLAEDGVYIADSPADAARGAGIVLTHQAQTRCFQLATPGSGH
jgi:3-hydroxyisobutyrate dehydrogenase-like beta-hydroxyacid dehydrogenase